jgi:hypothetical protein
LISQIQQAQGRQSRSGFYGNPLDTLDIPLGASLDLLQLRRAHSSKLWLTIPKMEFWGIVKQYLVKLDVH